MGFLRLKEMPFVNSIVRRVMPFAPFCSMMTGRSEVLLVLLLATYLTAELVAPITVQIITAAMSAVLLAFSAAISRSPEQSDEAPSFPFPFLAAFASRAPPLS
jgi:hypothetical protein